MQTSNTKLNKMQKRELATFKKANPDATFTNNGENATMMEISEFKGSKMKLVALSFASRDEQKFRRKVGEFNAVSKYFDGEFVKVPQYVDLFHAV